MNPPPARFAALILAAGASSRMGQPKALLDISGKPLICRLVDTVRQLADVSSIIAVTGHKPARIKTALAGCNVTFTHNPRYAEGEMISSIKIGTRAIESHCDAFFLCLLDQPLVQADTFRALMVGFVNTRATITVPTYHGTRGHPILINARSIPQILSLPATATFRDFVMQPQSTREVIPVEDAGILSDVDTQDDYRALLKHWATMARQTDPGKPQ